MYFIYDTKFQIEEYHSYIYSKLRTMRLLLHAPKEIFAKLLWPRCSQREVRNEKCSDWAKMLLQMRIQ